MLFSSADHSDTGRRPPSGWSWRLSTELIVLFSFASIVGYYYWSMGFLRLAFQILGFGS